VVDHTGGSAVCHFAAYDGNGNLTALVKTDQTVAARYEYGPFGEPIRLTGALAKANPFRWSTKFTDEESGLVDYGHRFYSPSLGRWISRDPIEENGGNNLYQFVRNTPISLYDLQGDVPKDPRKWAAIVELIVLLGRGLEGQDPSRSGSWALQAERLRQLMSRTAEGITEIVSGSGSDGSGKGRRRKRGFYQHTGGWGFKARAYGAALGSVGMGVSLLDGSAASDADRFVANSMDYARHQAEGDVAWADLDVIMMAIDMLSITGSSYVATVMWGALTDYTGPSVDASD
jgi:RHS repeat-associated protein